MDPSCLGRDLGISRYGTEGNNITGIPFYALLSDEEEAWGCLKRTVPGFLYVPTLRLIFVGVNGCMRTGPECRRMTRDRKNGKGWELCGGYHTEIVLLLTLLVFLKKITREEYYVLLSRFRRFVFGPDEGEPNREVIKQFIALVPSDVREVLVGSTLTLPEMGQGRGFVCLACGAILKELGVEMPDHLRVVRPADGREPSTRHLRA